MKNFRRIAATLAVLALGSQAQAQVQVQQGAAPSALLPDRYAEVSYVPLRISVGTIGVDVIDLGRLMLGVRPHPNVDVEAMVATSLADAKFGGTAAFKIPRSMGLFVKPGLDVGPGLRIFGRMGMIDTRVQAADGSSTALSDRSTAYGMGISYRLTDRVSFVADYMRYADFKLVTVEGTSLGLAVRF